MVPRSILPCPRMVSRLDQQLDQGKPKPARRDQFASHRADIMFGMRAMGSFLPASTALMPALASLSHDD